MIDAALLYTQMIIADCGCLAINNYQGESLAIDQAKLLLLLLCTIH